MPRTCGMEAAEDVGNEDVDSEDVGSEDVDSEDVGSEDVGSEDVGNEDVVVAVDEVVGAANEIVDKVDGAAD